MIRKRYLFLADALITLLAIILGLILRLGVYFGWFVFPQIWPFILLAMVVRPLIFYAGGVYKRIWRFATARDYFNLAVWVIVGSLFLSLITLLWLFPRVMPTFPRSLLAIEPFISFVLFSGLRALLSAVERYPGDLNLKNILVASPARLLVVGAGSAGVQVVEELANNPVINKLPVAILDDDEHKIGRKIHGLDVVGPLVRLPEIAKERKIDEVVIALPTAPDQTIQNLKNACSEINLPYSIIPSLSSLLEQSTGSAIGPSLRVPMSLPDITSEEIRGMVRVLQSGNLSIGSQTVEFEKLAAATAHAEHAVAVINGTSALHMCMVAAGIGPGDEVITSPFSFVSSANCILFERATPVFIDIDPVSLNLDPKLLEAAITEKTKAIIPVHVFGQPADMDPIMEIAQRHHLPVIEDACEAIGAEYKGRRVGAIGKAGAFAFYPNKQMTSGEGAVLITNDEEWANLFRSLRNQGRDKFDSWLTHSRLGYNYRMSELNATVGVIQIKRLDELLAKRDSVANEYTKRLAKIEHVKPLTLLPTTTRTSWFVYTAQFDLNINRDQVKDLLEKKGVPTRPYFWPIHLQPFYQKGFGFKPGDFPMAERAGSSILALPFHGGMKAEEVELVCEALSEVIEKC